MCAREQPKGDARSKADRGAIAVLHVATACNRANSALARCAVDLIQPRRAARTLLLAMLASLSRARVSSVAYAQ